LGGRRVTMTFRAPRRPGRLLSARSEPTKSRWGLSLRSEHGPGTAGAQSRVFEILRPPRSARPLSAPRGELGQAGALLTNHIAPGKRTLTPSTCSVSASRVDAMAAATTSAGWPRSQLFTAPIWVD